MHDGRAEAKAIACPRKVHACDEPPTPLADFPTATPEGKSAAVQFLAPLLRGVPDPVIREGYINRVGLALGLQSRTVEAALQRTAPRLSSTPPTPAADTLSRSA